MCDDNIDHPGDIWILPDKTYNTKDKILDIRYDIFGLIQTDT